MPALRTVQLSLMLVAAFAAQAGRCARADEPPPAAQPVDAPAPTEAEIVFFEQKIRPLFFQHCYECHSSQAKLLKGGLRLDSAAGLAAGGDSGAAVVPGKPADSPLLAAVNYQPDQPQMPPAGKLTSQEIADLTAWIEAGAAYPQSDAPAVAGTGRAIDFEAGRQFWSFRPLQPVPPPETRDAAWNEQPIDAFVAAELDRAGLAPSAEATRRALIRRATFDLTGLPPTPEEVAAFESDTAVDAWPRLVERLLASPRYGESWARFWLDLARYCDVPEQWAQTEAQAWLYRDWVIRALNQDLPYDQFVLRQLAADQQPDAGPEDLAALGFLGLSPSYWKELKLDPGVIKSVVAEEWEERINTLASSLLGLTVACARCHDHKFDPIAADDYYALAGVFASLRQAPRPLLPADEAAAVMAARERIKPLTEQASKLAAQQPQTEASKQEAARVQAEIDEIKRSTPHYDAPQAYAVEDASLLVLADGPNRTKLEYRPAEAQDVAMQIRGNPSKTGAVVPRRFLTVLSSGAPAPFQHGSGRLDLGQAIVQQAAPLTARVIVNRVWRRHFGRGLVDTPSNFGAQGARPSHPDLLEDLAARFVAQGWSLKWLHREILLSRTYRQASDYDPARYAIDPDNRLLWRMNRRRLDVEAWRDAMLAATGSLDPRLGGAPAELAAADNLRRTIYGLVRRRDLDDLLRLYDFPDPTAHSAGRETTTTPLQQLFVLNSGFVERQAAAFVERLKAEASTDADRVRRAYLLAFGRPATEDQVGLAQEFLAAGAGDAQASESLWRQYAQALLGSNEFLFVD